MENLCFKCGSTRAVSSVHTRDSDQAHDFEFLGWACKQCRDEMLRLGYFECGVTFGDEGFLDDNLTVYDEMEIHQKLEEFNELFENKGCSAWLVQDRQDFQCHIELIVDDDQPDPVAAVKEAESIIEKLCSRYKMPFSRKRRSEFVPISKSTMIVVPMNWS